jgi:hypothetical protein
VNNIGERDGGYFFLLWGQADALTVVIHLLPK